LCRSEKRRHQEAERSLVIVPETNEHQTGRAMKRIFGRLDGWHLECSF
jgi:hypothetical protein